MQRLDRPPGLPAAPKAPPSKRFLLAVLLLGAALGTCFCPSPVAAAETTALDRIASTLDKLLDAVRDGRKDVVECVCRCPS